MKTPTETELAQDYHAFCEMVRRQATRAMQHSIAGKHTEVQDVIHSLVQQAVAKKVSLETQDVLTDDSRFDLSALPKPGADDGLE